MRQSLFFISQTNELIFPIQYFSLFTNPYYIISFFCPQGPGRPHHRNAAASGANGYPTLSLKAGAPAKAAYAMMDSFFLLFTTD
jgi:hypothetical protein